MKKKSILISILIITVLLTFTGCIPGDGTYTTAHPAGFFWGVWHGWMAPLSLILGLFNRDFRIYELINTGWWYDFGFYIAIISGFGGLSLSRKKESKNRDK